MARAAGNATKKRGRRRHPPRAKKTPGAKKKLVVDIETLAALVARTRTVVVAPSALTDPAGVDAVRRGLPALDPALLPEYVLIQHAAMQRFNLRRGATAYPSKKMLMDFFMSVRLSDGHTVSPHLAGAMATFVRPVEAKIGGRPSKRPPPSGRPASPKKG